jgi:hypothetical protein
LNVPPVSPLARPVMILSVMVVGRDRRADMTGPLLDLGVGWIGLWLG